ncbi:hypothetical protein CAAN1_01S05512 [[Candida] anglica]|uniref:Uncharacterized protein n=1 Tax=[Candida] anglica TaxID=148631 RepID=A0ABP0EJM5_9ASCO
MVPILTIPETAFDPSGFHSNNARRSRLLGFLIKLTNGSAILLTLIYLIGIFGLKPLLELTANRRLEVLELFRAKLRDCYLNLIGKVSYIPIVAINKNDGSGKLYADAITQTIDLNGNDNDEENDKLSQNKLANKLNQLSEKLNQCTSYSVSEIPHYKTIRYCVKEFQNKADMIYFNNREFFTVDTEGINGKRKKNLTLEMKNEIRSIKGMYISGKV